MKMPTPNQVISRLHISYIFLFLLFCVVGITLMPPAHNVIIELYLWALSFLFYVLFIKTNVKTISVAIFLFQIISMILITWINIKYYNEPYGFGADDSLLYRSFGEEYSRQDIVPFVGMIFLTYGLDDIGYPVIVWLCFRLNSGYGSYLLLLLNTIVITWGANRLYHISRRFLPYDHSKLVMLLWGLAAFATTTACRGLKENFMAFVIIYFFYFLLRFQDKATIKNTLLVIVFVILTFFFRLATGYAVVLCFLATIVFKFKFVRNNIKTISLFVVIITAMVLPTILVTLARQRGMNDDVFAMQTAEKTEAGGGLIAYIMNIVSSIIGPFPCFVSNNPEKLAYLTRDSLSAVFKMFASFFFWYSLVDIFKRKVVPMFSMAIFVLINVLMLIIAFYGLHMRLQWPHMPLFIILSLWGYIRYKEKNKSNFIFVGYLVFSFLIVFFYNIR